MIITKTDQETFQKIEIQGIIVDKEIIPNALTGIIAVTHNLNTNIEAINRSIKDSITKYKQLKKQPQTPLGSMIQKIPNYN